MYYLPYTGDVDTLIVWYTGSLHPKLKKAQSEH